MWRAAAVYAKILLSNREDRGLQFPNPACMFVELHLNDEVAKFLFGKIGELLKLRLLFCHSLLGRHALDAEMLFNEDHPRKDNVDFFRETG